MPTLLVTFLKFRVFQGARVFEARSPCILRCRKRSAQPMWRLRLRSRSRTQTRFRRCHGERSRLLLFFKLAAIVKSTLAFWLGKFVGVPMCRRVLWMLFCVKGRSKRSIAGWPGHWNSLPVRFQGHRTGSPEGLRQAGPSRARRHHSRHGRRDGTPGYCNQAANFSKVKADVSHV